MSGPMDWIDALAVFHGGVCIGLALVVVVRYLWSRSRLPMLLISVSYVLLTLLNVRAVGRWGTPDSPWFWLSLAAWATGDAGLVLYLILGPRSTRRPEVQP